MELKSVSRVIDIVTNAIIETCGGLISKPIHRDACSDQAGEFYEIARISNVIGCVDGTLISLQRPSTNEDIYVHVSQKEYHAVNCMLLY